MDLADKKNAVHLWRSERKRLIGDEDHRDSFIRDRDRLMFSYAIQRLAGVSQVASPFEGDIVHNRLTHTLEMAQLGLRLSQKIIEDNVSLIEDNGLTLNPSVVESACLAHDIGHPPFGHSGESALNSCLRSLDGEDSDGFEGNAQSFRIATVLEPYRPDMLGLNLTRASLMALSKYPNFRDSVRDKWGWYSSEESIVNWVGNAEDWRKNRLEVSIMDIADDIAYGSHDLFDFYRAKLIPLFTICSNEETKEMLIRESLIDTSYEATDENIDSVKRFILDVLLVDEEYDGSRIHKANVRLLSSNMIKQFRDSLTIRQDGDVYKVGLDDESLIKLNFVKYLTKKYVQQNSQIMAQRRGFTKIIETIFSEFLDDLNKNRGLLLPQEFRVPSYLKTSGSDSENDGLISERYSKTRLLSDYISSLTDNQAMKIYKLISGGDSRTAIGQAE